MTFDPSTLLGHVCSLATFLYKVSQAPGERKLFAEAANNLSCHLDLVKQRFDDVEYASRDEKERIEKLFEVSESALATARKAIDWRGVNGGKERGSRPWKSVAWQIDSREAASAGMAITTVPLFYLELETIRKTVEGILDPCAERSEPLLPSQHSARQYTESCGFPRRICPGNSHPHQPPPIAMGLRQHTFSDNSLPTNFTKIGDRADIDEWLRRSTERNAQEAYLRSIR